METYTFSIRKERIKHIDNEINEIFDALKSINQSKKANYCIEILTLIRMNLQDNSCNGLTYKIVKKALQDTKRELYLLISSYDELSMDTIKEYDILDRCIVYLKKVHSVIDSDIISSESDSSIYEKDYMLNSKHFYNEKIEEINKEKEELTNQVNSIKEILNTTTGESKKIRADLEKKEQELKHSINLIKKYELEKLQYEKINDAKDEWEGKIIKAFENLKKYIKPIKDEHRRLGFLFWGYLGISVVIVLCLFIIEYIICCKIEAVEGFPTWETYLSLILPIPIAMGGLWGFVTLMHRVQRQLVILAKQIHEIEYVEGLLLTTNTLSTNINESMSKVNLAIEKLLENHLNYDGSTLTEELLLEKEEKKDAMPYEEVLKLVEKVAGMVSKNKE